MRGDAKYRWLRINFICNYNAKYIVMFENLYIRNV